MEMHGGISSSSLTRLLINLDRSLVAVDANHLADQLVMTHTDLQIVSA